MARRSEALLTIFNPTAIVEFGAKTDERRKGNRYEENACGAIAIVLLGIVSLLALTGCASSESEFGEHSRGVESSEQSGERESREGGGEHEAGSEGEEHAEDSETGEGDEESGIQYELSETMDEVRAGARLILSYDSASNAFVGTVENTTSATLRLVRVEVHLSNGVELGPTTPVDVAPGEVVEITLPATDQAFTSWSAHPEVG